MKKLRIIGGGFFIACAALLVTLGAISPARSAEKLSTQAVSPSAKAMTIQRKGVSVAPVRVAPALQTAHATELKRIGAMIAQGRPTAEIQSRWSSLISNMRSEGATVDVNALIQMATKQAYAETNKDLQFYAEKVRYYNDLKVSIREELNETRLRLSASKGVELTAVARQKVYALKPASYKRLVVRQGRPMSSKADYAAYIRKLEGVLASVGDDAQLANIDMQNMLQKQQQTVQMMSNISKMLHDTAMSVIRKMGG